MWKHSAYSILALNKGPPAALNLLEMQETWVQSLVQEDSLEKGTATHSSILAWKNPMDGGAWWATVHGVAKSRTRLNDFTFRLIWPRDVSDFLHTV